MAKLLIAALLTFALALAPQADAHEGSHQVKGVIKEVTAERLVLTDAAGKDVVFTVTGATEFFRAGERVPRGDARPGERAVVHGAAGSGSTAAEVKLGAAPTAR